MSFPHFLGTLWLMLPFLAVGFLSSEIAVRLSRTRAWGFFSVFVGLVGLVYPLGYVASRDAVLEQKWTAATMAIAVIPFNCIPVVVLAAIVAVLMIRKHNREAET